jgi:DNA-binding response OmpR family regulator
MTPPRNRLARGTVRDFPPLRRDQIRIAVAEDDAELRRALAETLRENGLEVVEAMDGATLLSAIHRGGITLAVTDLSMPGLCGSDVITFCRLSGDPLPFVVVTGAPDPMADGISGVPGVILLRKPLDENELLAAVARALAMAATPADPTPESSTD